MNSSAPVAACCTGIVFCGVEIFDALTSILLTLVCLALLWGVFAPSRRTVLRLGWLSWTEAELCRHFLITGDTGSGKTTRGINVLLRQLTCNVPNWGGMVLGVKGDEGRLMTRLAELQGRGQDILHLQVRPDSESTLWKPPHRFNLVGDRSIPWSTHAKLLVDIASSMTEGRQSAFFRPMAQLAIAQAFQLLDELNRPVHIAAAYRLLTISSMTQEAIRELEQLPPNAQRLGLIEFFETTFTRAQAYEQREAVEGTIKTFLGFFMDPDVEAVFSSDLPDTFRVGDVDHGKIITVSIPQRLATERRYVQTFLKLILYIHALKRFDLPEPELKRANLLLLVADEFQDIATASEDGMSDHKLVDRVRAAKLCLIAAMQSELSLDPAIGPARRKVLTLNLRSRLIFRSADAEGALIGADFVGKRTVWKKSRTMRPFSGATVTRHEDEEYLVKPSKLMRLRDGQAVVVHPSKRFSKLSPRPVY